MPKESVYGLQHGGPAIDADAPPPVVPIVDVLWNREGGFVQVASKAVTADGGRVAADSEEAHFTDGMYVDLDRTSINKLIRNLRRARDQAFGRDE